MVVPFGSFDVFQITTPSVSHELHYRCNRYSVYLPFAIATRDLLLCRGINPRLWIHTDSPRHQATHSSIKASFSIIDLSSYTE
jgi:hypothetical protein